MNERFFKEIRGWLKAQDGACCCLGDCNICSYHKCNGCLCTLLPFIQSEIELAKEKQLVTENTSDGYHTFKELYEFRKTYNACLFNEWSKQGKYLVHKSKKHSDGESCFGGGWFIVVATLPDGDISNHYEIKDWDLFQCEEREISKEWDGHSSKDVIKRLLNLITNNE